MQFCWSDQKNNNESATLTDSSQEKKPKQELDLLEFGDFAQIMDPLTIPIHKEFYTILKVS